MYFDVLQGGECAASEPHKKMKGRMLSWTFHYNGILFYDNFYFIKPFPAQLLSAVTAKIDVFSIQRRTASWADGKGDVLCSKVYNLLNRLCLSIAYFCFNLRHFHPPQAACSFGLNACIGGI